MSNLKAPPRLIRAVSAAAARSHMFGETVIAKASANDVARLLEGGGSIEHAAAQSSEAAKTGD